MCVCVKLKLNDYIYIYIYIYPLIYSVHLSEDLRYITKCRLLSSQTHIRSAHRNFFSNIPSHIKYKI